MKSGETLCVEPSTNLIVYGGASPSDRGSCEVGVEMGTEITIPLIVIGRPPKEEDSTGKDTGVPSG